MNRNIIVSIAVIVLVILGFVFLKSKEPKRSETPIENDEIVSENGIHWHPELRIFVNHEEIKIPENIGLGQVHNPIHTHDDLPMIHFEFEGLVRESDITLEKFFKVWKKDFMEFGPTVTMTVNGQPNTELQNYIMKDGDKIELHYE